MNYLDTFTQLGALSKGHFLLTSGLHSDTYFQCAKALQHPAVATSLCQPIADYFRSTKIDVVISPAIGGIVVGTEIGRQLNVRTIFAERDANGKMSLRRGFEIQQHENVLVVEDVITTGGSVKEVISIVEAAGGKLAGVGSIVDRSNGGVSLSPNQFSVVKIEVITFKPEECPLCKEGKQPAIKPGSRPNKTS